MKTIHKVFTLLFALSMSMVIASCVDLTETNVNPNGVDPSTVNPTFLMTSVLAETAKTYDEKNLDIISGVMQHTQQDAWSSGYNDYQWSQEDWAGWYGRLRDIKTMEKRAIELGYDFHQGVAKVMRSFVFGNIADLWGDAPYTDALKGDINDSKYTQPKFDSQETIYEGIITELKESITFFEKNSPAGVSNAADVYYNGDQMKWKKFAAALIVRYAMRISTKKESVAKELIKTYAPLAFTSNGDEARMMYPGTRSDDSYPKNKQFRDESNFGRNKMCAILVDKCRELKDPRIVVWADPVEIRNVISRKYTDYEKEVVEDGKTVRYFNADSLITRKVQVYKPATYLADVAAGITLIDTSSTYVGIPNSYANEPNRYNLNPLGTQATSRNPYVSYLKRSVWEKASGKLLYARIASYSSFCFTLAEAKMKGYEVNGTAADWYNKGVEASFDAWIFDDYKADVNAYDGCVKSASEYLAQPGVAFNNTLERIIEQKWLAGYFACVEVWADYKRTGLPALKAGPRARQATLPLRFIYGSYEVQNNPINATEAIDRLQVSTIYDAGNKNSAWAKYWLLKDGNLPW